MYARLSRSLFVAGAVAGAADLAFAGDKDPLFVSMTTDAAYRSVLAITVSKHMFGRGHGHPLTIFFNDRGILVTSKENGDKFKERTGAPVARVTFLPIVPENSPPPIVRRLELTTELPLP
jgi:hypothetical protein